MRTNRQDIDRTSWDEVCFEGYFKALIPPTWEIEGEDEILLFDPEGCGELAVSVLKRVYWAGKRQVANQVIEDWAQELKQQPSEKIFFKRTAQLLVIAAEFVGIEPEGDISYWRVFAIVGDRFALDVSYSCDIELRNEEAALVEAVVDSVRLAESPRRPLARWGCR